jgi:hypothetical protein
MCLSFFFFLSLCRAGGRGATSHEAGAANKTKRKKRETAAGLDKNKSGTGGAVRWAKAVPSLHCQGATTRGSYMLGEGSDRSTFFSNKAARRRRTVRRTARHLWLDKFLAWCGRAWKGVASTHTRPHSNARSGTERPFFTGVSVLNRSSDRRSHESNPWPQCAFETSMFCYLQFTLIHAVGCVLHRSTSRVPVS